MFASSSPVFVLAALYLSGMETPSLMITAAVVLICCGNVLVAEETPERTSDNFTAGIILMVTANAFEAIRLTLTQFLLTSCKLTMLEGHYLLAPTAFFTLFACGVLVEGPSVLASNGLSAVAKAPLVFVGAATFGVATNFSNYLVIQTAGSLTLEVLGTLRSIGLVLVGAVIFHEAVEAPEVIGYLISLTGFVAYIFIKHEQATAKGSNTARERLEAKDHLLLEKGGAGAITRVGAVIAM